MLDDHLRFEGLVLKDNSLGDKMIFFFTYSVCKSLKLLQIINLLLSKEGLLVPF